MKNKPREVIFKVRSGSYLYGTNTPLSDQDYLGVFFNSSDEMFGLDKVEPLDLEEWNLSSKKSNEEKNTPDDVDFKLYSLKKFFRLALEGQSNPIEMLFAPKEMIIQSSVVWEEVVKNREIFLSQNSILPFVNFAREQAFKSVSKGINLNAIRKVIEIIKSESNLQSSVGSFLEKHQLDAVVKGLQVIKTDKGDDLLMIAGKMWGLKSTVKNLQAGLVKLESNYKNRSELAAKAGVDYRSLHHAYRIVGEVEELLTTGNISFPRPEKEREFLMVIKRGDYQAEFFKELDERFAAVKSMLREKIVIPEKPDEAKAKQLFLELNYNHYNK